jgi:hypothetical protein
MSATESKPKDGYAIICRNGHRWTCKAIPDIFYLRAVPAACPICAAIRVAARKLIAQIRDSEVYVVAVTPPSLCGCGKVAELRHGFCFDCLEPFLVEEIR